MTPRITDLEKNAQTVDWAAARRKLAGDRKEGFNLGALLTDRHCDAGDGARIALRVVDAGGRRREISYDALSRLANRFANALQARGVSKGDRVFTLLGPTPELLIAAIGAWKVGAVFSPLFSAYGPKPIADRLSRGAAKTLVTNARLHQGKIRKIRSGLPHLSHVILTDKTETASEENILTLENILAEADEAFETPRTSPEDAAILHFTSGTTGAPKGVLHVHDAGLSHHATAQSVFRFDEEDVFWCTADPGWVTGVSYGIIAPLLHGVTTILYDAPFDSGEWLRLLEREGVTKVYTSPTALRMLQRFAGGAGSSPDFASLKLVASVGEPLPAELSLWTQKFFGAPVVDTWWQTETGAIMIAGASDRASPPGAIGAPAPGVEAALARPNENGALQFVDKPDETGELVFRTGWPSMFRAYLGDEARYKNAFRNGWYLSGDLARKDADGFYWFVSRKDDLIKSAGRLISPAETEAAILAHPDIVDAAIVGLPDELINEVAAAFIVLKPGVSPTDATRGAIMAFARDRLGPALAPKEIYFRDSLPRTLSGKIMRRSLQRPTKAARDAIRKEPE